MSQFITARMLLIELYRVFGMRRLCWIFGCCRANVISRRRYDEDVRLSSPMLV